MAYPTALTDHYGNYPWVDGTTVVEATPHNIHLNAIDALEEKVGVDGSAVTTSHDYRIYRQGVQTVTTAYTAVDTGTTTMPFDDTIPQNTEGDEFMTRAITPTNASNILQIECLFWCSVSGATDLMYGLFQDSTANAIAAGSGGAGQSGAAPSLVILRHRMVAGTTSATTFKFRAGSDGAGTWTMNGNSGARKFGGVLASRMTITEWKV